MAFEPEFRVAVSEDSVTLIGENVLVEPPRAAYEPAASVEAARVEHEMEARHPPMPAATRVSNHPTVADAPGRRWWKMVAGDLRVVLPLVLADFVFLAGLLVLIAQGVSNIAGVPAESFATMICVMLALIVGRHADGLYPGVGLNVVIELRKQTITTTLVFVVLALGWLAMGQFQAGLAVFLLCAYPACLVCLPLWRCLTQAVLGRTRWWGFPVLVFGCGPTARRVLIAMRRSPSRGLRPVGCVGTPAEIFRDRHGVGQPVRVDDFLGDVEDAPDLIERHQVQWVIAAMPESPPAEVARLVSRYAARAPHRLLSTGISDFPYLWQSVRDCGGQAGIEIRDSLLMPSRQFFKRVFDVFAVLIGGLLISPLLIAIALAIKVGSRGPVFYGQKRIGYAGKELTIWKFRSMFENADVVLRDCLDSDPKLKDEWERTHKLQNDPRITGIGRLLRTTSLDELPQLWNILKGEMSLVGPRPIVDDENYDREYVTDFPEAYELYLRVRPGLTGLWQVAGRQHRDYFLRPQLDAYYVRNWSIWLDLFLLIRTVKTVFCRDGAC